MPLTRLSTLGGGPCVEVTEGRSEALEVFEGDDPLDEGRWHLYARATATAGVLSSLSLPVYHHDRLVGGVNLYGSTLDAFTGRHAPLASLMGARMAEAVLNADLSFSTRLEAAAAPGRLRDRRMIETAVGILAAHRRLALDEARHALGRAAAQAGINETLVARLMISLQIHRD